MKASETTVRNLLEGTKQFQIPLFQRPYSWDKTNWQSLWDDLMSLYWEKVEGFYFLGPIVTQAVAGTAEGISPFVVIDGQQRLTTLTLLLATLRNHLRQDNPELADELYELYLINKFKKGDDLYKVLPTQDDREVYRTIIQTQDREIEGQGNIYEAYKFFSERLTERDPDEDTLIDYAKFKTVVLERLTLVNITSEDRDNPYLIFESLNYKGQELTQADLVRNYIFMKLPRAQQENVYNDVWLPLQKQFKVKVGQSKYAEELTNAFWYYLRKDGQAVNKKNIYQTLKEKFDKLELHSIKSELENLTEFANYYQRLNFPDEEPEPRLKHWFKRFLRLDFTTSHIFILNIYHEYAIGRFSLDNFERILSYLESYFIRRLFAGISTRVLGSIFTNLYSQVLQENSNDLVSALRNVMLSFNGNKVWPEDDSFRQGIVSKNVYTNSSIDRAKLLLERIEETLSKERVDTHTLTIEHIMPQTLTDNWCLMLGENHNNIHKRWLNTLGNLTLTGYNSELSNKPFNEKLRYLRDSNVTANQYFRNVEAWDEQALQKRAEDLANIAVKVWSR